MFKVCVKKRGRRLPKDKIYYILAKNGLFIHKEVGFIKATVPVGGIPWLSPQKQEASLLLPKLPTRLIAEILNFFKEVYNKYRSEAVVLSYYSEEKDAYFNDAPKQKVSGAGVEYSAKGRFEGYQLVGSVHSHSNFGAFHSSIDDGDEEHFDGFHITIGNVDDEEPTISASIMVNGTRFAFKPERMIDGIEMLKPKREKFSFVRRFQYQNLGGLGLDGFYGYGGVNRTWHGRDEKCFCLLFPLGKTLEDYPFESEWLKRVKKEKPKIIVFTKGKNYYPGGIGGNISNEAVSTEAVSNEVVRNEVASNEVVIEKEGVKT